MAYNEKSVRAKVAGSASSLRASVSERSNLLHHLTTLIEDRFYSYYPEFSNAHIHVKGSLLKKCHQSNIYQFDVRNTRDVLKTLIVKQRVYNKFYNNHVEENTQREYLILKELNSAHNLNASVPKVLDSIPDKAILITEKVKGNSLYSYLRRTSCLPLTDSRKSATGQMFIKIGKWLREFHETSFEGKKERINTAEFIEKAQRITSAFPSMGMPPHLGEGLINKMKQAERDVLAYTFPVTLKHGDFQPVNIMFYENNVTVLDISARSEDITIKDVCNFITGISVSKMKLLFTFHRANLLDEMISEFLESYYEGTVIPYSAIKFVKILGILEQFDNIYKRNKNYLKRKIIMSFYNVEMKALAKYEDC